MSKKLQKFLRALDTRFPEERYLENFVRHVVGNDPVDNADLSKRLDKLINLAKAAKNTLHPKKEEEEDEE
ncbi:MAG: hypothetical protein ACYDHY_06515 [Acidiferrobacterales bacterium]